MKLDITWTITAVIAVSAFLSPIFVAIINNRHQAKLRKMELEHDAYIKQLDLQHQATIRQSDIYYSDKKSAFSEFVQYAGAFSIGRNDSNLYQKLRSSIDGALLFCNEFNQILLIDFQKYIDSEVYCSSYGSSERLEYSKLLSEISLSLNRELEDTKPVINCESCEH